MNINTILSIFGVAFVLAKIFAVDPVADWSWWVVCSPFLVGPALGLLAIFLYLSFHIPMYVFNRNYRRNHDISVAIKGMRDAIKEHKL